MSHYEHACLEFRMKGHHFVRDTSQAGIFEIGKAQYQNCEV